MQYLPLYVMSLSQEADLEQTCADRCKVFGEKILSFFIFKAFNVQGNHLTIRQHAINYLSSLLARESNIFKPQTLVKCVKFILKFFNSS
jgi:hypothetical protein